MILTHGANSLKRGGEFIGYVDVGGRRYTSVQIGEQEWMAENLNWRSDDIPFGVSGTPSTPACWYFSNSSYYGQTLNFGLLYNGYAVEVVKAMCETLPNGWRVPTSADMQKLKTAAGSDGGKKLKSTTMWNGTPGTDEFGFNALPSEYRNENGAYPPSYGNDARYWCQDKNDSNYLYTMWLYHTVNVIGLDTYQLSLAHSIRLVRDI